MAMVWSFGATLGLKERCSFNQHAHKAVSEVFGDQVISPDEDFFKYQYSCETQKWVRWDQALTNDTLSPSEDPQPNQGDIDF